MSNTRYRTVGLDMPGSVAHWVKRRNRADYLSALTGDRAGHAPIAQLALQGTHADAEKIGGPSAVAVELAQGLQDGRALQRLEPDRARLAGIAGQLFPHLGGEVGDGED